MTDDNTSLLTANAAYYRAFASNQFTEMSRLWADDRISCVHPGWSPLIGREAIMESYREIIRNSGRERIAHHKAVRNDERWGSPAVNAGSSSKNVGPLRGRPFAIRNRSAGAGPPAIGDKARSAPDGSALGHRIAERARRHIARA